MQKHASHRSAHEPRSADAKDPTISSARRRNCKPERDCKTCDKRGLPRGPQLIRQCGGGGGRWRRSRWRCRSSTCQGGVPPTLLGCPLSHCSGRWLSALTRGEHSSIFARTLFDRPVQQDKAESARDKHHNVMRVSYWHGIFEKHEHL